MLKFTIVIIMLCAVLCGLLIAYEYIRNRLGLSCSGQQRSTIQYQPAPCGDDYVPFLERVLIPCVQSMYEECALAAPKDAAFHSVLWPDCARVYQNYGTVYCYDFKRQSFIEGGLRNFQTRYSTLLAEDIVKKINEVLPKYAISAGWGPHYIVDVDDRKDGVVRFIVGVVR